MSDTTQPLVTLDNLKIVKEYIDENISTPSTVSFSMRVEDGNLICDYPDGTEEPDFVINDEGLLVYTY